MKCLDVKWIWTCLWAGCALGAWGQNIVINEIMYHPSSENVLEEYIELYNAGTTNVDVSGWRLSRAVDLTFPPGTSIPAGGYLVAAADPGSILDVHGFVANLYGPWIGILSNSRDSILLETATGQNIDEVEYSDEGDWAIRVRGPNLGGYNGWVWLKEHDGLGKSLELRNAALPNEHGQNWASSVANLGSPGAVNLVATANLEPIIVNPRHFPIIPTSIQSITFSARLIDEQTTGLTMALRWRLDGAASFNTTNMLDNGNSGDGVAGDGLFGVVFNPRGNNTLIEYYFEARDAQGNLRTWPAAARQLDNVTFAQTANAALQVDDSIYTGKAPLYKLILTSAEYQDLNNIFNGSPDSDAQVNATFIDLEASGTEIHQLVGVRNRGHGSRGGTPHNYRINFRTDDQFQGKVGVNLNARSPHAQIVGAALAQKAGADGADSRAVQLRVNNGNSPWGIPTYGHFAANEVMDSNWAQSHYPDNGNGNVYKVIRDIDPPNFSYRGENPRGPIPNCYTNTYFKQSNTSEDDWTDLIGMHRVVGENNPVTFSAPSARQVLDVEQVLTHVAVMNLFANNESGVNTGNNDDYYLYAGHVDKRFEFIYHDLDSILGIGSSATTTDIFRSTYGPISGDSEGIWRMMNRFLHWRPAEGEPEDNFEALYYATHQRLLDTTFYKAQFDPFVRQTLGDYVPTSVINNIITWMDGRRTYVQGVITGQVPLPRGQATISGEPNALTWFTAVNLTVGGDGVVAYRYKLNGGSYSAETPVATQIRLMGLPNGSTNTVYVLGRHANGIWQQFDAPTVSRTWVTDTALPRLRLNEVLARNDSAVSHEGTFPDMIELFNQFVTAIDLSGMRLTDDPNNPDKYQFPPGTMLPASGYLTVYANDPDLTSGIHVGFNLDQDGDAVYLFNSVANGGKLIDWVQFGQQLPNLSIGRVSSQGAWILVQPSRNAANVAQPTGNPALLKINEWLAMGLGALPDDFIELYNPDSLPVALGGLYLTDIPIGAPARHRIQDATFIDAGGFARFVADGSGDNTGHVGFNLAAEQGKIALLDSRFNSIDYVAYGPQSPGVSTGRCPDDGGADFEPQVLPTPGAPNLCPGPVTPPELVPLIQANHVWKYSQTGSEETGWATPGFIDTAWPSGPGMLAIETCGCTPDPILTTLVFAVPRQITFYFRTTFSIGSVASIDGLQMEHAIDDGAVFYLNGQEVLRYNMPGGTIRSNTLANVFVGDANAYSLPVNLPLNLLQAGQNTLAVEVHNQAVNNADIAMGLKLSGLTTTNLPSASGLSINEILASNTITNLDGSSPDMIELFNPSATSVNLAGLSLSDAIANPRRYVIPSGVIIPGQGHLVLRMDPDLPPSTNSLGTINTGFGMSENGDALYLFDAPANGGGLLDYLEFGLQTADFSIGRVPSGGLFWDLSVPTLGAANIQAVQGNASALRINEWMATASSGGDWFEVYNPGALPVALGGCYFTDDLADTQMSPVPALSFLGGNTNAWKRFFADGDTQDGANHVDFSLAAGGEDIGLFSPSGVQIDAVVFDDQTEDVSQGRFPDGTGSIVFFPGTASPGESNFRPLTSVAINEVLTHSDDPLEDAIEVRNMTGAPIDIGGWWLSDARSVLLKYQIPPGTILPANGYWVFYENRFNSSDFASVPFSLSSAEGDQIYLTSASGGVPNGLRHTVEFGPSLNGLSFGRYNTTIGTDFVTLSQRTFGVDTPSSLSQFRAGTGLPNAGPQVGPIVFSEIMYHPVPDGTNDNVLEEFVELHNITASTVPLYHPAFTTNTWRVRRGIDFDFPQDASIPAGGFVLLVSFNPATDAAARSAFEAQYGPNLVLFGPYSGKLDNGGEEIELRRPDNPQTVPGPDFGLVPYVVAERIVFSDQAPWPLGGDGDGLSLQRIGLGAYGNDPVNWRTAAPTPEPGSGGLADTDGDGMPDVWESANGLNPSVDDADGDLDLDGMTNLDEYNAGTDPRNPASVLEIVLTEVSDERVTMRFMGAEGKSYRVRYRTSLTTGGWTTLTNIPALSAAQQINVIDPTPGSSEQRFYQISTP